MKVLMKPSPLILNYFVKPLQREKKQQSEIADFR